jgi:hypothetical protein
MPWDVAEFCQDYADEFATGDLEAMASRHALALAVYRPDGLHVRMTREDLLAALRRQRGLALAAGMARIRATVLLLEDMRDGRLPLMIEWSFLDGDGREIARNRMRHYCRRGPDGRLMVEMVEILRIGFPDTAS